MVGLSGFKIAFDSCTGVEIHLMTEGCHLLRFVQLSLDKELLHIKTKKELKGDLLTILKGEVFGPIALTITGKGVLIKKTERLEMISEQSLVHLFPQLKLADFYVQHFASGDFSFIAMIRKDIVNGIIDKFKLLGLEILSLSLGPFVANQVFEQVNAYGGSLNFDGHQVALNTNKSWESYSYHEGQTSSFVLKVDIEVLPEEFLVAYATAFQLILNEQLDLIEVEEKLIKNNLLECKAKLKFKKMSVAGLFVLFALLLINFLIFSHYHSENETLLSRAGVRSDVFLDRQQLEQDVKAKEELVHKLGWNKGYPYAYLCDQIGQMVPKGIKLEQIQMNPLSELEAGKIKGNTSDNSSIRIKGQASNVYVINEWMYALKDRAWVKQVQLEKYTTDDKKQVQVFTIHINY